MIGRLLIGLVDKRDQFAQARNFEKRDHASLLAAGLSTKEMPGEREWYDYWKPLLPFRCKWAYRLYSQRCGHSRDIVCESAIRRINTSLNHPMQNQAFRDKNFFDRIFPGGYMPQTILRRFRGVVAFADYKPVARMDEDELNTMLAPYGRVILKPTQNTDSGNGVRLFARGENGSYTAADGTVLTPDLLLSLPHDFILQEALTQHPFMAAFNPTSVNTLRIATYRSVSDNKIHILSGVIRMGMAGAVVDNLHSGGRMVRINIEDGTLADYCCDQHGRKFTTHGNVDFKATRLTVPQWHKIKDFAIEVASRMDFSRLVQHDIMLDTTGAPRLIEVNVTYFSVWIAQLSGTTALGRFTDEIREYAIAHP